MLATLAHGRGGQRDASREISCLLLCFLQNECSGRRWCDEPELDRCNAVEGGGT